MKIPLICKRCKKRIYEYKKKTKKYCDDCAKITKKEQKNKWRKNNINKKDEEIHDERKQYGKLKR
jgi:ribosomal protein L37E